MHVATSAWYREIKSAFDNKMMHDGWRIIGNIKNPAIKLLRLKKKLISINFLLILTFSLMPSIPCGLKTLQFEGLVISFRSVDFHNGRCLSSDVRASP